MVGFYQVGLVHCGSDIWVEVTTVSPVTRSDIYVTICAFGQQAEFKFSSNNRGRNPEAKLIHIFIFQFYFLFSFRKSFDPSKFRLGSLKLGFNLYFVLVESLRVFLVEKGQYYFILIDGGKIKIPKKGNFFYNNKKVL